MAGAGIGVEHAGAHASYRESVKALLEQWEGQGQSAGGASRSSGSSSTVGSATTTMQRDPSLSLLLPLLILLSTLLFLLIFFLIFLILVKRGRLAGRGGIALGDNDGPLDLSREEELDGEGGLRGVEQRWLEQQDEGTTAGYERAKRECRASRAASVSGGPMPNEGQACNSRRLLQDVPLPSFVQIR